MPRSRRRLLRTLALGTAGLALAGCVNRAPTRGAGPASDTDSPTTPAGAPTGTPGPDHGGRTTEGATGTATNRGPRRPDGDPVSVERRITDPELDYLPDADAVKYPAYYRRVGRGEDGQPTRTTVYETTPFADWAATECASVGSERVAAVAESRLDGDPNLGVGIANRDGEVVVSARQTTTLDREGTVVSAPSTPFDRVVAVVPRAVTATVHLEGQSHTRTVPVWVAETVLRRE